MATITVHPKGMVVEAEPGTTIGALIEHHPELFRPEAPLAAIAYNRLVGLGTRLHTSTTLEPVYLDSRGGMAVYRRTASLMLIAAVRDLYPEARVVVGQSLADGYFFEVVDQRVTAEFLAEVEGQMRAYVERAEPVVTHCVPIEVARELFEREGHLDKVGLLRAQWVSEVEVVELGSFRDLYHGPVAGSAAPIQHFRLVSYPPGMVLRFDARDSSGRLSEILPTQNKLFQTYRETRAWNEILGVHNVGRLNRRVIDGSVREIIRIADGLHEKKIAAIADMIVERRPDARLVMISGPSSSGKTTFSKRLAIQLRVAGLRPVTLSLDNWYVNRVETPRQPVTGDYDFECLEALDLALFNENLGALLGGEEVSTPIYDFKAGLRRPRQEWPKMRLADDQVLIAEGIHGLNDQLTASIAAKYKFKVYVSALTQLCLDDHNRIFTSDTRLVRRLVRDARYRGYSGEETITRWPSVREGERRYIFPFQEEADVMFNSALVYEMPVLKVFAERFLLAVEPSSPAYVDAYRLLKLLKLFVPIFRDDVPQDSILREFIGGSAFAY